MKARSIARELALLGISQLADTPSKNRPSQLQPSQVRLSQARFSSAQPSAKQLDALLVKALRALSADAQEAIETAEGELQRSEQLLLESETRTSAADEVRSRIQPALPLVQAAINRLGTTLELLIFVRQGENKPDLSAKSSLEAASRQLENGDRTLQACEQRAAEASDVRVAIRGAIAAVQSAALTLKQALEPANFAQQIDRPEVRSYACDLLDNWVNYQPAIDAQLDAAMEKWNIRRLARVDRDILRLAMMEIVHLGVPKGVAIDEAIEMAKRYSDEEGYRFINGVLRRATDKLKTEKKD